MTTRGSATVPLIVAGLLALTIVAGAHEGPVYNYPVTVDDVTVREHSRSVVCEEDGTLRIAIRQKLTINSRRGAEEFTSPVLSWRAGTATAWLLESTVRRDGRTRFHLGPRPDGPALQLHPSHDGTGPVRRARVPLPALQAHDTVEWAVEIRREPLITGHIFAQMNWSLQWPVEKSRFSIEVARGTHLQSRSWGPIEDPLVIPEGDRETWLWRVNEAVQPVSPAPGEILPLTVVTTSPSWEVVGRWFQERLVAGGDELGEEAGPALVQSVADLPHRRRLRAVLDHVRGLELPHVKPWCDPFTARRPAEVLESGIGDCKDRAWLMYRTLEEAGMTPHLAVTGLSRGLPALEDQPPTPLLVDHVLVGVSGPGRTVWLDPTGAAEEQLDRGRALDALVLGTERHPVVKIQKLYRPTG
jgi:hypothetical protein